MAHESLQFMKDCVDRANFLDEQKISYRDEEVAYLERLKNQILAYRENSYTELLALVKKKQLQSADRDVIWEFVNLVRRYYFINATFQTIEKPYQEMCSLLISVSLQVNNRAGYNFLKYFDPNSTYYLKIKALYSFRSLKNPEAEIEQKFQEVSDLLWKASEQEPKAERQIIEILKEYLERVFSLKRKTLESRAEFVAIHSFQSWKNRCANVKFSNWLIDFLNEEKQEDLRDLREPTQEDFLESDRLMHVQAIESYITHQNQLIVELQKKIEFLQKQNITELYTDI